MLKQNKGNTNHFCVWTFKSITISSCISIYPRICPSIYLSIPVSFHVSPLSRGIYRVMFLCCSGPTPGLDPLCLFISTQNPALYIISPCAGRSVDSSLRVVQRCVILDVYKLPHPYKHVFLSQQLKQAYKPFYFWVHLTHNTKRRLLAVVVRPSVC